MHVYMRTKKIGKVKFAISIYTTDLPISSFWPFIKCMKFVQCMETIDFA